MFGPFVRILNRLSAAFLSSTTGKPGKQATTFFSLLAGGFFLLSWLWLGAVGMIAERDPAAASDVVLVLVPLALAAGCFWLVFPGAWSDALHVYIPRAIVLVVIGLAIALVGVSAVDVGITSSGQRRFGDMLFSMLFALFIFTIALVCFWAAVPTSWKNPGTSREEVLS